jgi:hypothetical protein
LGVVARLSGGHVLVVGQSLSGRPSGIIGSLAFVENHL